MGDAADDLTHREIHRALYPRGLCHHMRQTTLEHNRNVIGRSEWTMRDGTAIKFDDMDLRHLGNVVSLVEQRGHKYAEDLREYYEHRLAQKEPE